MTLESPKVFPRDIRPPTPPKDHSEHINEALDFLNVDYSLDKTPSAFDGYGSGLGTPPKSSPAAASLTSSIREKRVEFRSWTTQHHGPSPQKTTPLRPLPQTRAARPLKSILKANLCQTPTPDDHKARPQCVQDIPVPEMLESIATELSSDDLLIRLDGYQTLNQALKAYDNFPRLDLLKERIPHIQQCILRDIQTLPTDTRGTNIINEALKLCSALFALPIQTSLSNDFRSTLLDSALTHLGGEALNKAVAKNYLCLLASSDFRPPRLNQKAELLFVHLEDLPRKLNGNSAFVLRLVIYQRLIEQLPTFMLGKIRVWVENVFHACLSSNDECCKRAIDCGLVTAKTFDASSTAQRVINDLFGSKLDQTDGQTFGNYFLSRLTAMLKDESKRAFVPQIWSVIILCLRSTKRPIHHWPLFKQALRVIQECLNSTDLKTRNEAIGAWNRFVFVADLSNVQVAPAEQLVTMLFVPFQTAFSHKIGSQRLGDESRKVTHAGYTNLLYYALQPGQSHDRLDILWNIYARKLLPRMLRTGGKDGSLANRILKALFQDGAKHWDAERATQSRSLRAEELCRLDPAWVRSRLPEMLESLKPWLAASLHVVNTGLEGYETCWRQLVLAVAEAGSQEIRTSNETRQALAQLMNFLSTLWREAQPKEATPDTVITRFGAMVLSVLEAFGVVSFMEGNLAIDGSTTVLPAPTPSARPSKTSHTVQSPFMFVIKLLSAPHPSLSDHESIIDVVEGLLNRALRHNTATLARLEVIRNCLSIWLAQAKDYPMCHLHVALTDSILLGTATVVQTSKDLDSNTNLGEITSAASAVLIASLGLQRSPKLQDSWASLYNAICTRLDNVGGSAATRLGLIEPLTIALSHNRPEAVNLNVHIAQVILSTLGGATYPQQLSKAHKMLQGQKLDAQHRRVAVHDPLDKILGFIAIQLRAFYDYFEDCTIHATPFLYALQSFLTASEDEAIVEIVHVLRSPISLLIKDEAGLFTHASDHSRSIRVTIQQIWHTILPCIKSRINSLAGSGLVEILIAGFCSRQRAIVSTAVEMWNSALNDASQVDYPTELLPVLSKLREHVELELPGFSMEMGPDSDVRLPAFTEPADEENDDQTEQTRTVSPQPVRSAMSLTPERQVEAAPLGSASTVTPPSKVMPPPRLRHEDSQIEFISVENLPSELTDDGTQGMTEHQREVQQRQQQDARMFPQISSSPVPPSTGKNLIVDRVQGGKRARLITPEPQMSDQEADDVFGSSPIVRSVQRKQLRSSSQASEKSVLVDETTVDETMFEDVPSSPPDLAMEDHPIPFNINMSPAPEILEVNDELEVAATIIEEPATTVPDALDEVTSAASVEESSADEIQITRTMVNDGPPAPAGPVSAITTTEGASDARMEEPTATTEPIVRATVPAATSLAQGTKRKLRSDEPESKKRQRRESPIKRIFSWFGGSKPETEDIDDDTNVSPGGSDIEDCIVVATQPEEESVVDELEDSRAASQPVMSTQAEAPKARRGRPPRKSRNPRLAASPLQATVRTRRRSSRLSSNAPSDVVKPEEEPIDMSSIPSPPKTRRRSARQMARRSTESPAAEPTSPISHLEPSSPATQSEGLGPDSQLHQETMAAALAEDRAIASPKSIIGRLRDLLGDVRQLGIKFVLGPQEEVEMSRMLFELGGEANAAGRRAGQ